MLGLADRRNQRIIAESRQHVFVILNERFHCGTHLVVDRRIHGNHHTGAERPIKRRDKRHALRQRIHASDATRPFPPATGGNGTFAMGRMVQLPAGRQHGG